MGTGVGMSQMELINRTNFLLEPLLFMERNGIWFQKVYLLDRIIKSDNGMFLFTFHSYIPILLPIHPNRGSLCDGVIDVRNSYLQAKKIIEQDSPCQST